MCAKHAPDTSVLLLFTLSGLYFYDQKYMANNALQSFAVLCDGRKLSDLDAWLVLPGCRVHVVHVLATHPLNRHE